MVWKLCAHIKRTEWLSAALMDQGTWLPAAGTACLAPCDVFLVPHLLVLSAGGWSRHTS